MFCTAHTPPRPAPVTAEAPRHHDARVRAQATARRKPGQIFTDWASI